MGWDFLKLIFFYCILSTYIFVRIYGFNGTWDMLNTGTVSEQVMLLENIGTSVLVTENQVL